MSKNLDREKRLLEVFYEHPGKRFTVRQLEKLTKMPRATVHVYVSQLRKQGLISEDNQAMDSILFKTKKTHFFIEQLVTSGLIEHIITKLNPSCIILFGSIRKGESDKDSDIDLFVETHTKTDLQLERFEKQLNHKIQLHIREDIHKLQPRLFNNVVNGIKMYGSFKIK